MTRFIYDTSEETRIKEIARLREKALHDEASALKKATEEGIAKGRAEGEAKGAAKRQAELIANMKAFGMTDEQINAIILGGQKR